MQCLDDAKKWFLIDWDDATVLTSKTIAQPHLNQSNHSPYVFVDGHGTEVDMWGVGELILQCKALDVSSKLSGLGEWMQGPEMPSAQEALSKIKEYQTS